jgi:sn-glycerol 3-phosphate transport system ATP-binding protein
MGRAIVREPKLFLFDEPLSNLDAKLRVAMRAEIKRLQRRLGVTSLFVTHDQVEAMTLGDRLVVMHEGRAAQIASPMEISCQPPLRKMARAPRFPMATSSPCPPGNTPRAPARR